MSDGTTGHCWEKLDDAKAELVRANARIAALEAKNAKLVAACTAALRALRHEPPSSGVVQQIEDALKKT